MPGSSTTPGRTDARTIAPVRIAFRPFHSVGTRNHESFAARWLAYALPYRRFACTFTGTCARLGADAVRYSFIARDSHPLLLAGLTGARNVIPFSDVAPHPTRTVSSCQEPTCQRAKRRFAIPSPSSFY